MIVWHGYEIDFPKLKDTDMADLQKYTSDLGNALSRELLKFNSQLAEAQKDFENLGKEVEENIKELEDTKTFIENSMKTLSAEGTSIHVTDSADYGCKLKVEGKSEQVQTETSPSPDYPSQIENVSGDLEVKVVGKNLAKVANGKNKTVINEPTIEVEDNTIKINGTCETRTAGQYSVKFSGDNIKGANYPSYVGLDNADIVLNAGSYKLKIFDVKGEISNQSKVRLAIKYQKKGITENNKDFVFPTGLAFNNEYSFTLQEESQIGIVLNCVAETDSVTFTNVSFRCGLYRATETMLKFEPYKEQTVTFPLGEQKLMKDGYLAEDGIHNKRKQIVLDGTESYISEVLGSVYLYEIEKNDMLFSNAGKGLCSHFINYTNNYSTRIGNIRFGWNNKKIYFYTSFPTLEEFKNWLAEQYSAGTPVIVEYEMQEEEVTPYTEEQATAKKQIDSLKTYRTVTNVSNSQNTNMKLTYKKDLQTQFQELEAMLLESGV